MSSKLKWFLGILVVLILIFLIFIGWQNFYRPTLATTPSPSPTAIIDDWLTYTNDDIGYWLKYPKDWTIKETDEISQFDGKRIKFIHLYSADQKYVLTFGLKKADDDSFRNFERTGVGGELIPIPEKATTILSTSIIPEKMVIENKTKEFFYRTNDAEEKQCNCNLDVFYGPNNLTYEEEKTIDLPISLLDLTNRIIESVQWSKTYTNEQYGFTVQYPEDWEVYEPGEASATILVSFGHPLNGKQNYVMNIQINENPAQLSSKEWVEEMLAKAQQDYDVKARPDLIKYQEKYELTLANLPAYELDDVFAFDQSNEQIYLANNTNVFEFSFPVAEENPNLSAAIKNNQIIHQILSTFKFLE